MLPPRLLCVEWYQIDLLWFRLGGRDAGVAGRGNAHPAAKGPLTRPTSPLCADDIYEYLLMVLFRPTPKLFAPTCDSGDICTDHHCIREMVKMSRLIMHIRNLGIFWNHEICLLVSVYVICTRSHEPSSNFTFSHLELVPHGLLEWLTGHSAKYGTFP